MSNRFRLRTQPKEVDATQLLNDTSAAVPPTQKHEHKNLGTAFRAPAKQPQRPLTPSFYPEEK